VNFIDTSWTSNLAYAVGLIATDGCLSKDGRHIDLTSKDLEQVENFKNILSSKAKVSLKTRGTPPFKSYYHIQISNVSFYRWLKNIGLTPNKSKTLGSIKIPDSYL